MNSIDAVKDELDVQNIKVEDDLLPPQDSVEIVEEEVSEVDVADKELNRPVKLEVEESTEAIKDEEPSASEEPIAAPEEKKDGVDKEIAAVESIQDEVMLMNVSADLQEFPGKDAAPPHQAADDTKVKVVEGIKEEDIAQPLRKKSASPDKRKNDDKSSPRRRSRDRMRSRSRSRGHDRRRSMERRRSRDHRRRSPIGSRPRSYRERRHSPVYRPRRRSQSRGGRRSRSPYRPRRSSGVNDHLILLYGNVFWFCAPLA